MTWIESTIWVIDNLRNVIDVELITVEYSPLILREEYSRTQNMVASHKPYSLNLNQWIITDISAKYATGNQWMKCEISNLANYVL